MKIVDANVLLYAIDPSSQDHAVAKGWVEETFSSSETVGLAWIALLSVLRLSTNPAVYDRPLSAAEALGVIGDWLSQPAVTIVDPTERHLSTLGTLLDDAGAAGNLTSDAHLAAIAIERGATLASFDADFHRFSGLKFEYLGKRRA